MRFRSGFTNSELVTFADETDRRVDRKRVSLRERDIVQRLRRSPPNPRDQSLSSLARDWCDRLPPELRCDALCKRYPRIANRLALCWDDPKLTAILLRDLLLDRRGGRSGYPAEVRRELVALRDGTAQEVDSGAWSQAGVR